jgi:hypothetical protein
VTPVDMERSRPGTGSRAWQPRMVALAVVLWVIGLAGLIWFLILLSR